MSKNYTPVSIESTLFLNLLIQNFLDSNDLLNYKTCVIKTCFQRDFEFIKKNFICQKKSGTVTKVKLVTKVRKLNQLALINNFGISIILFCFVLFFVVFFLSGLYFTNIHDSQDSRGRGGHLFTSFLPLPPASQTLRHQPGDYCRELTSAHSCKLERLVSECKLLTTKLRAHNCRNNA